MEYGDTGVNYEILGGLKAATEKGEDLKTAMISFFQAGYGKVEIEEAAKAFLAMQRGLPISGVAQPKPAEMKPVKSKPVELKPAETTTHPVKVTKEVITTPIAQPSPIVTKPVSTKQTDYKPATTAETATTSQKVSGYGEDKTFKKEKGKLFIVILMIVLFLLLGFLGGMIFFKNELTELLKSIF